MSSRRAALISSLALLCICAWGQEAQIIDLPEPSLTGEVSLEEAIAHRRSVRSFTDEHLTMAQVGQLLWAAQGITEPNRGLRAAPSAMALYPLEIYAVTPEGTYHYLPDGHRVERTAEGDLREPLSAACRGQASVREAAVDLVIAGVFARMQEKFGDKAVPVTLLEVGHVTENVLLQAVAMGLGGVPVGGQLPDQVAQVLSLPEGWTPVYVVPVGHPKAQ